MRVMVSIVSRPRCRLCRPLASPVAAAATLAVLLAPTGCTSRLVATPPPASHVVPELYESVRLPEENLDSLAGWEPGGWIVATAKATHRLIVFAAADGSRVRTFGELGDGPGQFRRPNGVAVVDDLLLVTERDNRRVQVLRLPDFVTVSFVGVGVLRAPYGIAAFRSPRGIEVYVTDSYLDPEGRVPPAAALGERVRHFLLTEGHGTVDGRLVRSFGDTSGSGVLHVVESIAADPERHRLLVADEWEGARDIKVYDLDGRFTGVVVGRGAFTAEPEGLALVRLGEGGFWIAADQDKTRTRFLVFDRVSLEPLGFFTGTTVANTDGIALLGGGLGGRASAGLVAVNSDASVAAFPLTSILQAIRWTGDAACPHRARPCRACRNSKG